MAGPLRVTHAGGEGAPLQPRFVFDVGSAESWLVAERVLHDLPELAEWWPVHGFAGGSLDRAAVEERALARGLEPRWPATTSDTRQTMLAAVFAKSLGKTVAFCLAAFRQTYAGGRDPGEETTVLLAGAAAEMHPRAVLGAVKTRAVSRALEEANEFAAQAGVVTVPAIVTPGGEVFAGDDGVEAAAAALAGRAT